MEAILCLPSALSAPFKGPGRLLLHRHTRNDALLGRISFPRSRPRSHTVVSFSHVPPPPPRLEEDKGRAGLARARKGVKVGAAVVAAVACALGAVTVLRGAPVGGGAGSAMAVGTAGGDGKSVTMTAGSSRGDANQQGDDVGTGDQRTPIMVREILFGTACKKPWVSLLDHAFTDVLRPSKRLQLMKLIYQLDQSIPSKKAQKISEIFSSTTWLSEDEKHEVGITLTQVYIDLKDYRTAKEVCTLISRDLTSDSEPLHLTDSRPPLLMAVIDMMLATEKLLSMNTRFDDPEVQNLIDAAKESWRKYKKLELTGFGREPPNIEDIPRNRTVV